MGPAFYVMAILGCGEAEAACQPVAMTESRYESLEACNQATPAAVERHSEAAFPVVVAQCQRADAKIAHTLNPEDIDLPEPVRDSQIRQASHTQPEQRGL